MHSSSLQFAWKRWILAVRGNLVSIFPHLPTPAYLRRVSNKTSDNGFFGHGYAAGLGFVPKTAHIRDKSEGRKKKHCQSGERRGGSSAFPIMMQPLEAPLLALRVQIPFSDGVQYQA